jgi:predicted phage tail protein
MAKVMHLTAWFLLGCISSSTVAFLAGVHPALQNTVTAIYVVMLAIWAIAWIADDAIAPFFKLPMTDYYGILIALGVSVAIGGVLQWLLG